MWGILTPSALGLIIARATSFPAITDSAVEAMILSESEMRKVRLALWSHSRHCQAEEVGSLEGLAR